MIDVLAVRGLEGVDGARQPPRVSEDDLHFSRGHILGSVNRHWTAQIESCVGRSGNVPAKTGGTQPWLMKDGVVNADGMQSEECRPSWLDAISQGGGGTEKHKRAWARCLRLERVGCGATV